MNFFRQRTAQTLPEWLETATGKLVPSAQARVRSEIEAHFAEAVQAHLAGGMTEPAAQAAALADLGHAKAAARRFGREHLTNNDAGVIAGLIKNSARSTIAWFVGLLVLFTWMSSVASRFLPHDFKHTLEGFHSIIDFCILYALDVPGIYFGRAGRGVVAGIDPPSTSLIRLLRFHFIFNIILGVFCLGLGWGMAWTNPDELSNLPFYFAVFLFAGHKLFRLRRKLQMAIKDDPGHFRLPPPLLD
jgi:hypothetical protein